MTAATMILHPRETDPRRALPPDWPLPHVALARWPEFHAVPLLHATAELDATLWERAAHYPRLVRDGKLDAIDGQERFIALLKARWFCMGGCA